MTSLTSLITLSENASILKNLLNQYNKRQLELKILLLEGKYKNMDCKTVFYNVENLSTKTIDGIKYNTKVEYIQKSRWLFVLNYYYDYSNNYINLDKESFVSDIIKGELLNLDGLYTNNFLITAYNFYQWVKLKFKNQPKYINLVTSTALRLETLRELTETKQIKVINISGLDMIELLD